MHIKTNIYYAQINLYNICDELITLQMFILLQLTNLCMICQRPSKLITKQYYSLLIQKSVRGNMSPYTASSSVVSALVSKCRTRLVSTETFSERG